jgi:RNA polymerase subunit RPABC4/transcription elongation factor Spt4
MHFCRNWGDADCHYDVSKWAYLKNSEESKETALWPDEKEMAKMDEFCKLCEARFFELKERVCPVCGGEDFKEVRGFVILNEADKKKLENYYLKCNQCQTPSILKKTNPSV